MLLTCFFNEELRRSVKAVTQLVKVNQMENILEDQHRMFIQAFMWKKICSADEVISLHKKCHERNGVPLSNLKAFVEKINSAIRPMNMDILKGIDEITGEDHYVLINNATDNTIARLSTEYKTNETELFKKIMNCIIESDDGKVTSTTILNLSDEVQVSKKEADEIINKFCDDGWLIENEGYIYFSTRAIVELQHFFKMHFEDEILLCNICRKIVFQGETCKNTNCEKKFHKHCMTKYFSNITNKVCPICRTPWE